MTARPRRPTRLEAALASDTPLFLVDDRRRVVFFNVGCERLTGRAAADVVGRTCEYRTDADPASVEFLLGVLCPPPDLHGPDERVVPAFVPRKDAPLAARMIHFFPLLEGSGAARHVLGVIAPIKPPGRAASVPPAQQLHAELASARAAVRERYGPHLFLAGTPEMQRVVRQIALAARSTDGVLIRGAAGTGREHVARLVHLQGESRGRSFVPLDCRRLGPADLKPTLKRLFEVHPGKGAGPAVEQPGTVYLADCAHLDRDVQEWLVGALRSSGGDAPSGPAVRRAEESGSRERPAPLRIVAAVSEDPQRLLEAGTLLPEFFFLVSAVEIRLPLLCERRDELDLLAQQFLETVNRGRENPVGGFDPAVLERFREYQWPGNLDELEVVVHEAATACRGPTVALADLPLRFRAGLDAQSVGPAPRVPIEPLDPYLERIETERIRAALRAAKGNKSLAADLVGWSRARLLRRIEQLGIAAREEDSAGA